MANYYMDASALALVERSLIFVSGDKTLLAAAQVEGLATDTPFDHVSPQDTPIPDNSM